MARYDINEIRISAVISLNNIPMKDYERIMEILKRNESGSGEGPIPNEGEKQRSASNGTEHTPKAPKSRKKTEEVPPDEGKNKWDSIARFEGWELIRDVMLKYESNPEKYAVDYITVKKFVEGNSEFSGKKIDLRYISLSLAHTAKKGLIEQKKSSDRYKDGARALYKLPVLKDVPEEERKKPEQAEDPASDLPEVFPNPEGRKLRAARSSKGLSIKELSDMMGYDAGIISRWECGAATMSIEAKTIARKVFGYDIFGH